MLQSRKDSKPRCELYDVKDFRILEILYLLLYVLCVSSVSYAFTWVSPQDIYPNDFTLSGS